MSVCILCAWTDSEIVLDVVCVLLFASICVNSIMCELLCVVFVFVD